MITLRHASRSFLLFVAWSSLCMGAEDRPAALVDEMPADYHLYAYDDCGVAARQPHVETAGCYNASAFFILSKVSIQERSAVFSRGEIRLAYNGLDPARSYILALTYPNRGDKDWAQSLTADDVELHGPLAVPSGQAKRVLIKVPAAVTQDGTMRLRLKNRDGLETAASIVELWATGAPQELLRMNVVLATPDGLSGHVTDMSYQPAADVSVRLVRAGQDETLATATTSATGAFTFPKAALAALGPQTDLEVIASRGALAARKTIPVAEQSYKPVQFHPMPAAVDGLAEHTLSLNGKWRMNPDPKSDALQQPLSGQGWGDFQVPGQWAQQGFDIPLDQTAAIAREFTIPAEWADYRIFLRFDAIHAGTHYWLNGKPLGYSENLFTPVEWEITDAARPGQTNRLDLAMVLATASEQLSNSCFYTKYLIGGIDRSVRIFAIPRLHVASMHVDAGLDATDQDGVLAIDLALDNPQQAAQSDLELSVQLHDAAGKLVEHSQPTVALKPLEPGEHKVSIKSQVPRPLKWNAEQPNLYKLVLELRQAGRALERIERNVGFRKIEIRGRQVYVNGARIKLAGVCRHEADPLTGRADTARHAETDVRLYKRANLNCVRTAHYPCTEEFLDAADRLGLYVDYEAPLCWVNSIDDLTDLPAVFTPTSAMIDVASTHPSVIIYSMANESIWSPLFDLSNKLCKELDPSRLTTFNNAIGLPGFLGNCDIANQHYPQMPFDKVHADDPRPLMIGECFFEVYHERTDVTINPALRELWAHGSADPESAWGKFCIANYTQPTRLRPGIHPGAWSHIYASERLLGSEIWSGVDDIVYLNGEVRGCENGNALWGLIDGWRREKPEIWLAKFLFSPVWFPSRQVAYQPGQVSVRVPVENRYSFTDLKELTFTWTLDRARGDVTASVPPAARDEIEIAIPAGTAQGKKLVLRALDAKGELAGGATITLGAPPPAVLPEPRAGAPEWQDDGKTILVKGEKFAFAIDRAKADFDSAHPAHRSPLLHFPALHVTRLDYGDLGWGRPPHAEFPDAKTRVVESVTAAEKPAGLEITIHDRYEHYAGSIRWLIDKHGLGRISYDYEYTGPTLETREVGIQTLLDPQHDEVRWRRWSEWGDLFPKDHISRTVGRAQARRGDRWPDRPAHVRPDWPWSLDETELGTADFRSVKFNIYDAALIAPDGSGVAASAAADAHFRPCLSEGGVKLHLLAQCTLAPVVIKKGDRLQGSFAVRLLGAKPAQ